MAISPEVKKRRPKDTPFTQQTMRAYKPVPTIKSAVTIFCTLGIVFIIVGSVLLSYSLEIKEVRERYDDLGNCKDTKHGKPQNCIVTLDIDEDMEAPIYFYYELHNFYQNHRRYVKSKSYEQLMGEDVSKSDLDICEPVITMDDLGRTAEDRKAQGLGDSDVANPCGLIAKTMFNDTYVMQDPKGSRVQIHEDDIAWASDKDRKFSRIDGDWEKKQWLDVEDEHFIVWMRTSGLPNFRKLWGRIEDDLDSGKYSVNVTSLYDVSDFDGEKYIVLSTANALGGKNNFLGIAYLVVGSLTLVLAAAFIVKGCLWKRNREIQSE